MLWAARSKCEEVQPVPACDATAAQTEVIGFSNATATMKSDDLTVVSLSQLIEVGATPGFRMCKATATLSDGSQHVVTYKLEKHADGRLFVYTNLMVFPNCTGLAAQGAVLATVSAIDAVRKSGNTAAILSEQQEVSSGADRRACRGVVTLSDRSRHETRYAFVSVNGDIRIEIDVK